MSTSTEWYAYLSVSPDHRNLASGVRKSRQSVIFLRVYNFPNEEDSAGEFIQNHQEKGSVEFDSRRARKIPRSPCNLLHCGPGRLSAILMYIQHGSVDHLQRTKQNNLQLTIQQAESSLPPSSLCPAKGSPAWSKTEQQQFLGRSSPVAPIPTTAPTAISPLKPSSFTSCAESNPQTAGSQRTLKMTDDKKLWKQRNLVI